MKTLSLEDEELAILWGLCVLGSADFITQFPEKSAKAMALVRKIGHEMLSNMKSNLNAALLDIPPPVATAAKVAENNNTVKFYGGPEDGLTMKMDETPFIMRFPRANPLDVNKIGFDQMDPCNIRFYEYQKMNDSKNGKIVYVFKK